MLPVELKIRLRNRVGVEAAIWTARRGALGARGTAYAAIDHHLSNMDILRLQLAGHALDQAGQPHLAHGKGR
jgi:hypothetical protein